MSEQPFDFRGAMKRLSKLGPGASLNDAIGAAFGLKVDRTKMKPIALDGIVGCSFNGHPHLGHQRCVSPGIHRMIVTVDGDWICHGCNGYVTKADAEPALAEGRKGFERMVDALKPKKNEK